MRRVAALLAVVLVASSALARVRMQEPAATHSTTSAPTATGHELFVSAGCAHCHMIDGAGGKKGPNLSGIGRRWKNDAIRKHIEEGSLEMPSFKEVLSESDLATLVAYLHTRRAAEPKAPPRAAPASPEPSGL